MINEYVYENISKLKTPVGYFSITSDDSVIPFSVIKNVYDIPSEVRDEKENVIGFIHTEDNYSIVVETRKLQIKKNYIVRFHSNSDSDWGYCATDEHTTCFNTVIGDWTVGIGSYDPNDQEKDDQMMEYSKQMGYLKQNFLQRPPEYDESNFVKYSTEPLHTYDGYSFKIYDYSTDVVTFEVAWIEIKEYPTIEYEGALGFWLS